MAKKLKDDNINLNLSVGTDKTQENIRKLGDETAKLKQKNDQLLESMAKLEAQGLKNTTLYQGMSDELKSNTAQIKANNKEIDELSKSLSTNQKNMSQLRKMAKELSAQMDKLDFGSEEWEKLNKQYQEVRDRMGQIKSATYDTRGPISKFADTINRYWSVIAAGAAAVVGAIKGIGSVFSSVINSTQGTADKWNSMVAGMKSGWDYFMKSIATGDWSNFFSNLDAAVQAGRDYYDAMAESDKKLRALRFTQADDRTEIARLKAQLQEYQLSATEKLKIQEEIDRRTKRLSETEISIRQEMYDAQLEFLSKSNGITETADKNRLERFVKEYNENEELIDQVKEYNKQIAAATTIERKYVISGGDGYMSELPVTDYKEIQRINEETPIIVRDAADALKDYNKLTREEANALAESYANLQSVREGQFNVEEQQNRQRSKLLKQEIKTEAALLKEKENIWETEHQNRLTVIRQNRKDEQQTEAKYQQNVTKEDVNAYNIRIKGYEDFLTTVTDSKLYKEVEKKIATQRTNLLDAERAYDQAQINLVQDTKNKELKVIEQEYDRQRSVIENQLADRTITQEQYDIQLLGIESGYTTYRLSIQQKYYTDVVALELKNGDLKAKAVEEGNKEVMDADVKAAQDRGVLLTTLSKNTIDFQKQFGLFTPQQELDAQLKVLADAYTARFDLAMANEEDITALTASYEKARTNILRNAEQERYNIRKQLGITTWQEDYDAEVERLQGMAENQLISEEELQEAMFNIRVGYLKKYFDYYSNLFSGAITALQDAEIANIEAKYDAEIAAAGNNTDEVERLEREKAQKTLDIQKKYADVNFAIKASQIIADTSVAIMQAFAQLGPVAGAVAAALMGITGIAQLAAANAERKKVKAMTLSGGSSSSGGQRVVTSGGFADGGYTGDGGRYEVAGPVHKGEYVVAVPEMRQPTVMSHVRAIERIRSKRSRRNALPGYADGGYTGDAKQDAAAAYAVDEELKTMLAANISLLQSLAENGVKAPIVLSELEAKQALKNTSAELGTR